jgi:hypothetical protein
MNSILSSIKKDFWNRLLTVIIFVFTVIPYSHAQLAECNAEEFTSEELDEMSEATDCNMDHFEMKCVRIKFHWLNNTSGPITAPCDAFYFDLLQQINKELAPGKIRFTFDYNCIHRETLTSQFSAQITSNDVGAFVNSTNSSIQAQMEYDPNAINVYTLQSPFPTTINGNQIFIYVGSYAKKYACVPVNIGRFDLLMHELGHTIGLSHTFSGSGFYNENYPESLSLCCKDKTHEVFGNLYCEWCQDRICDTGIDPYTLSLDGDGKKDWDKWVNYATCTQKTELVNTIQDDCGNATDPWEIPIHNFMSYYKPCRAEFTACQFGWAHQRLSAKPELLLDCDDDPFSGELVCSEPDITITNTNTEWTNQTINLCPGQKIIIPAGKKLTVNNCTITREYHEPPLSACPDLFYEQLWDGIYIEGQPGSCLNCYYNFGKLEIKNSSVIEYSKNGIQAKTGCNKIEVNGSTFRNNMCQIQVYTFVPGTTSLAGPILLKDSEFSIGPANLCINMASPKQFQFFGHSPISFDNCVITNPNNNKKLTAIESMRGKIRFINGSSIDNFHVGISKMSDPLIPGTAGLYLEAASITNSDYSVFNRSKYVYAARNKLEGDITSEGIAYSTWIKNNINCKNVTIKSPVEACKFENNLFENATLHMYGENMNSYSLCDTWSGTFEDNIAFSGAIDATLPSGWGDENNSSGNRHLNGSSPYLIADDNLINFHYAGEPTEYFAYDITSNLIEGESVDPSGCSYDYPNFAEEPIENFVGTTFNFSTLNTSWNSLNETQIDNEGKLGNSSRPDILQREIDVIKFKKSEIVGNVLGNITDDDSLIIGTWLARANPKIEEISGLQNLWYKQDFTSIISEIGTPSNVILP